MCKLPDINDGLNYLFNVSKCHVFKMIINLFKAFKLCDLLFLNII